MPDIDWTEALLLVTGAWTAWQEWRHKRAKKRAKAEFQAQLDALRTEGEAIVKKIADGQMAVDAALARLRGKK